MRSVRLQDIGDIPLMTKNGKNPFEKGRQEVHRSDRLSGNQETVFSDAGSRNRKHRLTTDGEEELTCTLAACPYRIGEHGSASLAECGIRLLTPFRRNRCAGIIRRRLKQQQACDRL
ncbi:hypothetical protein [Methanoculleus horonobensis]|jgi:hypothetical protein|uniref:hypothetical protein n=1 Tax=Methanoculleus horonobensis TaxID=528314 RepID=UPI0008360B0B|nr:hypothetical protein [Methanoculleus horonobensis]